MGQLEVEMAVAEPILPRAPKKSPTFSTPQHVKLSGLVVTSTRFASGLNAQNLRKPVSRRAVLNITC